MAKAILLHVRQELKCTTANLGIIWRSLWIPLKKRDWSSDILSKALTNVSFDDSGGSVRTVRIDVRAGELRKFGIRIKLNEQPVKILVLLLQKAGEVVLREEIRLLLWPNGTVVEFDHGINVAIQKLRDALGESAEDPRYVETVARRGYRFIGEVETHWSPAKCSGGK